MPSRSGSTVSTARPHSGTGKHQQPALSSLGTGKHQQPARIAGRVNINSIHQHQQYPPKHRLGFVFNVEAGYLEAQALLLAESIRTFAGRYSDAPIWVVQPRKGPALRSSTLDRFLDLEVFFIQAPLNFPGGYKFLNKACSAAFIEEMCGAYVENLVYLDSDTIVLNEPAELILEEGVAIAVRPVDKKNIGSPMKEAPDSFWTKVYDICQTPVDRIWSITSSFDRQVIRAYFQGGLICAKPENRIFSAWRDGLIEFLHYENDPVVIPSRKHRFYMEQACLAATILGRAGKEQVKLLNKVYNYPLHQQAGLPDDFQADRLDQLAIAHYHHAFAGKKWWDTIEVGQPHLEWLKERLPIMGKKGIKPRVDRQWRKIIHFLGFP